MLFELRHGASTGALDSIVLQIARDLYCVACGPARIQGAQRLPCTCVHIQHSVLPPVRLPLVHNRVHSIRRRDADDSVADMDLGSGQSNRTHSCGRGRGLRGREWRIADEMGAGCGYSWGGHLSRPTKHNVLSSSVAREQRRDKRVCGPLVPPPSSHPTAFGSAAPCALSFRPWAPAAQVSSAVRRSGCLPARSLSDLGPLCCSCSFFLRSVLGASGFPLRLRSRFNLR